MEALTIGSLTKNATIITGNAVVAFINYAYSAIGIEIRFAFQSFLELVISPNAHGQRSFLVDIASYFVCIFLVL
jgi:ubiquitin C-terminal hydrolase